MAVESVCWHKAEVGGSLARSLACAIAGVAPASEPLDATVAAARHADWLDELLATISRTRLRQRPPSRPAAATAASSAARPMVTRRGDSEPHGHGRALIVLVSLSAYQLAKLGRLDGSDMVFGEVWQHGSTVVGEEKERERAAQSRCGWRAEQRTNEQEMRKVRSAISYQTPKVHSVLRVSVFRVSNLLQAAVRCGCFESNIRLRSGK
jgi:hypothetical protein